MTPGVPVGDVASMPNLYNQLGNFSPSLLSLSSLPPTDVGILYLLNIYFLLLILLLYYYYYYSFSPLLLLLGLALLGDKQEGEAETAFLTGLREGGRGGERESSR